VVSPADFNTLHGFAESATGLGILHLFVLMQFIESEVELVKREISSSGTAHRAPQSAFGTRERLCTVLYQPAKPI
jgi:hypothetical protein